MARYSREGLRRAERVRTFLRTHIVHPDGAVAGKHFELEDWQWEKQILPVYGSLNRRGRRKYTRALFGVPRWHDKSTMAAALALYHLAAEPVFGAEEYAVATTQQQAGIVFRKARRMALADPLLARVLDTKRAIIEVRETGATFQAMPHDADTAQGYHPAFAAIDELHVHKTEGMLNAMISGSAGFPEPLILVITTAGEKRSGVWWETRRRWKDDPNAYLYWVGASDSDDATDPDVWRKANPASWITDEILQRQFHSLPLAEFERYHLNRAPQKGRAAIFTEQHWAACGALPVIDPERPCVIAVDASLRRDHTAVVLDQFDEQKRHNVLCFTFTAEDDDSIMGAIDHDEVGNLLRELASAYKVRRVPCDRAYFVLTMRQLLAEGLPIEEFPQTHQNMARACQRMYDAVTEGRMAHGNDPVLAGHVMDAAVKETSFGWRITKADAAAHIDAAVALAMAVDIAEAEAGRRPPGVLVG
jgi:phage terminase large subunit-like protein